MIFFLFNYKNLLIYFSFSDGQIWKDTEFELLRIENKRIVLCLDYSTSMSLGNRHESVMQAAVQFLSALPVNSYVGLIAFHGRVQTLAGLTLMKDRDSWQNLKVIKLFFF